MARIFYYTATGHIYGVHPGPHEANPKIVLPSGVVWRDVLEAPDKILWPGGSEQTCKVDLVTRELVLRPDFPLPGPNADLKSKIDAAGVDSLVPQTIKDVFTEWRRKL